MLLEDNCPDRSARRLQGKFDHSVAQSAARMALCSKLNIVPKSQAGAVEAMRIVSVASLSAIEAGAQTIN